MVEEVDVVSHARRQKPVRALVVDDSPLARNAIRLLLQSRQDVEVVGFASDGEEALAQIEALSPDLILMDIEMPKLDGLSAARIARRSFPGVRIIIITVNQGVEVLQNCMTSGADGLVTKDRLYEDLFAEIQRVFPSPPP